MHHRYERQWRTVGTDKAEKSFKVENLPEFWMENFAIPYRIHNSSLPWYHSPWDWDPEEWLEENKSDDFFELLNENGSAVVLFGDQTILMDIFRSEIKNKKLLSTVNTAL